MGSPFAQWRGAGCTVASRYRSTVLLFAFFAMGAEACAGRCRRRGHSDDWGCSDRAKSGTFGCSSFHGRARDCYWECDASGGADASPSGDAEDTGSIGGIVGGVIGGMLYLYLLVWAVGQFQQKSYAAHPAAYVVLLPFLLVAGAVYGISMLCKGIQKKREQCECNVGSRLDSCIVAVVTWCVSVKERAAARTAANAAAQPAAVEIQQAPAFKVVDGQVVQPAGVVQPAAVPVQVDTDGDGVADSVMMDTTGDGQLNEAVPMGLALE